VTFRSPPGRLLEKFFVGFSPAHPASIYKSHNYDLFLSFNIVFEQVEAKKIPMGTRKQIYSGDLHLELVELLIVVTVISTLAACLIR
ncbi:MAG: hypothetical protein QME64_10810, partial [bacterium]|nr:hypothetical protein [bacterium]